MCWTRQALLLRKQRYAAMEPAHAAYERGTELNEGLATYVELRARKRLSPQFPAGEFGPDQIRQRAYVTGAALAFLLDRFRPNWAVTFATEDSQSLDAALDAAVATSAVCAPDEAAFAATRTRAKADIQQHQHQRAQRLGAFHGSAGWKVVIESAPSAPLWPQGFDPLNVERVDATHIMHKRYLKLGNDNGQVEIMGTHALTEGFGPHPLFQGIRELVIPGLPEPDTRTTGHKVEVNAGAMKAVFEPATATVSGNTVTIRLGKR
jgi:hypothetical protein